MKTIRPALLVYSLVFILVYFGIALLRMRYAFDLEWMEGGMADHLRRVLNHRPLYVPPSLDFVPFIYPPLYYYACALFVRLAGLFMGAGHLPLLFGMRLVSFAASLVSCGLIFVLVRRETRDPFPAFLSSALFVATFSLSGAWFDLARLDSLFLMFVLAALYAARRGGIISGIAAGLLFALAFLTKQSALFILLPVLVYCFLADGIIAALAMAGAFALVAGGAILYLNIKSQGWCWYYLFTLPGQHPWYKGMLIRFWTSDIFLPLGITLLLVFAFFHLYNGPDGRKAKIFFASVLSGALLASYFSRLHIGGFLNVLMPVHAALAMGFGLGLRACLARIEALEEGRRNAARMFLYLACFLQFSALVYNPLPLIPTTEDSIAGREFQFQVSSFPGDVYILYHGYLPEKAGKAFHAHYMAVQDVLRGKEDKVQADFRNRIEEDFKARRFSAVFCDEEPEFLKGPLEKYYAGSKFSFIQDNAFWTFSGIVLRPSMLYLPKK